MKKCEWKHAYGVEKLVLAGTERERNELAVVVPDNDAQPIVRVEVLQQTTFADQLRRQVYLLGWRKDHLTDLDHVSRQVLSNHGPRVRIVPPSMFPVFDV